MLCALGAKDNTASAWFSWGCPCSEPTTMEAQTSPTWETTLGSYSLVFLSSQPTPPSTARCVREASRWFQCESSPAFVSCQLRPQTSRSRDALSPWSPCESLTCRIATKWVVCCAPTGRGTHSLRIAASTHVLEVVLRPRRDSRSFNLTHSSFL